MSEYDARLTDRVRTRGVLRPDDAARLLLPLADSLAGVHAVGASHGAVGPDAVLIDTSGRATLLDRSRAVPDPAYGTPDGSGAGRGQAAADDVRAFGGVLHFATTGHAPDERDPGSRESGWLGPVIELALHPDPWQRPTMVEVADYLRPRGIEQVLAGRRPSPAVLTAIGGVVVIALALAGAVLLVGGGSHEEPAPAANATSSAPVVTATPDPDGSEEPTATASAQPRTAAELEAFARTYVATASSDPSAGYALLTRDYQQVSPRYEEVWRAIEDPVMLEVRPDPATLSVSYVYRYRLAGNGRRTEEVTLRLVERGDDLLIAGASARRL